MDPHEGSPVDAGTNAQESNLAMSSSSAIAEALVLSEAKEAKGKDQGGEPQRATQDSALAPTTRYSALRRPEPTVLTWQDLTDLPRQILPEETYAHLLNARREAMLALFSLWKSINKARRTTGRGPQVRKRIEVE